jgi:hypothetical protein
MMILAYFDWKLLGHIPIYFNLPNMHTLSLSDEKEEGYDEWLRDRLESTIKKLDSGEMKTHTLEEVREHLKQRRAERRNQRNSPSI